MTGETLNKAVRAVIDNRLADVHTALPGRIESYDHAQQRASVSPVLRKRYRDGQEDNYPVITNVPVIWPRGGGGSITMPLQAGDGCLLVFSERSIERWANQGGTRQPGDPRWFDLSDAIAIPGLYSFADGSLSENNQDLLIRFGGSRVRLTGGGDIEIETGGSVTVDAVGEATVNASQMTVNCDMTINGDLSVSGDADVAGQVMADGMSGGGGGASFGGDVAVTGTLTATVDVEADGIELTTHTHGGVEAGGDSTGPPE